MSSITVSRGPALTIGAISRRTGVNIETIRFYERVGILPKPPRSAGGHRIYSQEQLRRLGFVRRSRELGFSLDEVRGLLQLVDGGRPGRHLVLNGHIDVFPVADDGLGWSKDPWGGERVGFHAKGNVNRVDFGLKWNQALETGGVLVGDKVEIEAEIQAVKQVAAQVA